MPPKSRSSTFKASSGTKAPSLGFSSSKKGSSTNSKSTFKKAAVSTSDAAASSLQNSRIKSTHPGELDDIEIILRVFDSCDEYGPCSRISRLERFERAQNLGLGPDPEIGEILRSEEGQRLDKYRKSVFDSASQILPSPTHT
ncbi:hypothetical protein JCM11641_001268 [Rhodosporidiobolus odoratus]